MAKVVMPIGGTGTQVGCGIPCVVKEDVWKAKSPSDFMDTNGEELFILSEKLVADDRDTNGFDEVQILGDFSSLAGLEGMYLYFDDVVVYIGGADAGNSGYYELTEVVSTTSAWFRAVNLNGDTAITTAHEVTAVVAGGAGRSITDADTRIGADVDLSLGHLVTIYTNLNESISSNTTIATNSDGKSRIRLVGTTRSGVGGAIEDFQRCESVGQFPVITETATLTIAGNGWCVDDIVFDRDASLSYNIYSTSRQIFLNRCYFKNKTGRSLVYFSGGVVTNCIFEFAGSLSGYTFGAVVWLDNGHIFENNIVLHSNSSNWYSVYSDAAWAGSTIKNNIIINYGSGEQTAMYVIPGLNKYLVNIQNNLCVGFKHGITIGASDLWTSARYSRYFANNVIWGDDSEGSIGINGAAGVATDAFDYFTMKSNFIGNVDTLSEFNTENDAVYELLASPVQSGFAAALSAWVANKTYANLDTLIQTCYMNDTANGGALVKTNSTPLDYSLNGTRDNFQYGPIMAEPAAGGGGGGFVAAGIGRFGVQES